MKKKQGGIVIHLGNEELASKEIREAAIALIKLIVALKATHDEHGTGASHESS